MLEFSFCSSDGLGETGQSNAKFLIADRHHCRLEGAQLIYLYSLSSSCC